MINQVKISVIIVCYGLSKTVFDTIDSVLMQTQDGIELIVSDDGSGRFSKTKVEDYIEENKRDNIIQYSVYEHKDNVGTVKNLNRAIKIAKGRFIKLIGGDDVYYDKNVFLEQIRFLEKNDKFLLVTGMSAQCDQNMHKVVEERTEETNKALSLIYSLQPKEAFVYYQKKGFSPFVTQAICFRMAFFEKYGLFDEDFKLMEDAPTGARLILSGVPVGVQELYTVKHRMNVGISANDDLFSDKKIRYYEDRIMYCRKYSVPNKKILGRNRVIMDMGISKFRLEMALAKKEKKNKLCKMLIGLKYIYPIFLYVILRPGKTKGMIKKLLPTRSK